MSLYEVERLVRRLEDYLAPNAQTATLPKDTQDYTTWINAANQRLEQVVFMIDNQDLHQAMQLERVDPCLSDLVMHLDFPKSRDLRKLCAAQGLAEPPKIKRAMVARLNDLFAADLDTLDGLWKEYNGARLQQDFDVALNVIRRIIKAKPDDKNALQELHELEKVDFTERFQKISDAVQAQDFHQVMSLIEVQEPLIQQFGLDAQFGQTWVRAKEMQLRVWMSWVQQHRQSGDWQSATIWCKRVRDTASESGVVLQPAENQMLAEAEQWSTVHHNENEEDQAFNQHYLQLQELLGQASLPNRQPSLLTMEDAKLELNQLSHAMQNSMQFSARCTQRIDQQVHDAYMLRSKGLGGRIEEREGSKKKVIALVCFVLLVGISVSIILFALRGQKKGWVEQAQSAMDANLCLSVSNLVVKAETDYGTNSIPSLMSATYADAKKWLSDKNTRYVAAKRQIQDLQSVTNNLTMDKLELVSTNVTTLSNQLARCCGDEPIQNELKLALLEVQKPFTVAKLNSKTEGEELINQVITELDETVQTYQKQPNELFKLLPELRAKILSSQKYATNSVINIRPRLAQNCMEASARLEKLDANLTVFRSNLGALGLLEPRPEKSPKIDVASFISTVEAVTDSEFSEEEISTDGKRAVAALKKDYRKDMVRDVVFQSDGALMNFAATAGLNLFPTDPLSPQESGWWQSLPAKWEYTTLMTNSVKQVTLEFRNNQNRPVKAPIGPHLAYWFNASTVVYLTPKMVPMVGKAPVLVPRVVIDDFYQQYKFLGPVLEYRDFYGKEFNGKYIGGQPSKFTRSPWDYLESLSDAVAQKRLNALIAAHQQKEILNFILSQPIERQLQYGIPSSSASQTFINKLKAINIPGLDAKAWFLNPELEQKHAKELGELDKLIAQTKGFSDYRELLAQAGQVDFEFIGFYQSGVNLFEGANLASDKSVIYLKKAGTYGTRELGMLGESDQDDNQGPVEFSPLFAYKYNLIGVGSYEDMENKYEYFNDLPKSLKKALSETENN